MIPAAKAANLLSCRRIGMICAHVARVEIHHDVADESFPHKTEHIPPTAIIAVNPLHNMDGNCSWAPKSVIQSLLLYVFQVLLSSKQNKQVQKRRILFISHSLRPFIKLKLNTESFYEKQNIICTAERTVHTSDNLLKDSPWFVSW